LGGREKGERFLGQAERRPWLEEKGETEVFSRGVLAPRCSREHSPPSLEQGGKGSKKTPEKKTSFSCGAIGKKGISPGRKTSTDDF